MSVPRILSRFGALLLGFGMVAVAIAVSNDAYSWYLLGANVKELSWGPTLFRALLLFHGVLLISIGLFRNALGTFGGARSRTHAPSAPKTSRVAIWTLLLLTIVAIGLRLWNLNSDLWIDEVLTLLDFVRKPLGEILTSFPSQNQHMLFSVLAHISTSIFGESAWSLRAPSIVFGAASIWAFFFLCKNLVGEREALLASALMTVSYHHIWFSQNARGYMGLLLFTLLATWCWLEAIETSRSKWWFGYSAATVLGMWVHPTMAFVVAAQCLIHIVLLIAPRLSGSGRSGSLERKAGWKPFAAWLLSATVTLQLYALALPEFLAVGLHEESKDSEWTNPIWVFSEALQNLKIGFAGSFVLICGAAFVAFGWARVFKLNRRAGVIMVLPAAMAGASMVALGHNIWPRFFFFSMGFGLLIVVHGAMQLPRVLGNYSGYFRARPLIVSAVGIASCTLLLVASLSTLPRNYSLPKQNFSEAKNYVESHLSKGDGVVAVSLAGIVYGSYLRPYWPVAATGRELTAIELQSDHVWLVYTLPIEVKAFRPELWNMIENHYQVVKVFPGTLNGGEVFVCQRKSD